MRRGFTSCPLNRVVKNEVARLYKPLVRNQVAITEGCLTVLRHGFKCFGKTFRAAYFASATSLNQDTLQKYQANRLHITRQVAYSKELKNTLDIVISLNGIPISTIELKNPLTNQTWRDAVRQYRTTRDPNELLFRFGKRTLVHFAVDPDEVRMTTKLAGEKTHFLPFNRVNNGGSGNPDNLGNYKTAYLLLLPPES